MEELKRIAGSYLKLSEVENAPIKLLLEQGEFLAKKVMELESKE